MRNRRRKIRNTGKVTRQARKICKMGKPGEEKWKKMNEEQKRNIKERKNGEKKKLKTKIIMKFDSWWLNLRKGRTKEEKNAKLNDSEV